MSLDKRFIFFGENSNIHGMRFVFKEEINFFARLFWILILLAFIGSIYLLIILIMERGTEVNFMPETRYLHWTTNFPAVTVCETYNPKQTTKAIGNKFPELSSLDYNIKRHMSDLIYGRGFCSNKEVCAPCGSGGVSCDLPWRKIIDTVRKSCSELLSECSYNGDAFPCCKKFNEVESEYGTCYSFNTLQTKKSENEPLFSVNRSTGPSSFSFRLLSDGQVSLHSPEELATNDLDPAFVIDVKPKIENEIKLLFSVVETENDPFLQSYSTHQRGCRYLHETPDTPFYHYGVYSYGACRLARDTEHSFERCGCVHPVRDKFFEDKYCNFTGINCLVMHTAEKEMENAEIDFTDCLTSCVESELTMVDVSKRWVQEEYGNGAIIYIKMANLPTLRYKRNLLRNELDLVVSVGGIIGLFFGASILSFVEIFYLFLRIASYK